MSTNEDSSTAGDVVTDENGNPWQAVFGPDGKGVEVTATPEGIRVRHSEEPDGVTLHFTKAELAAFIAGCKAGEFDDIKEGSAGENTDPSMP